MLLIVDDKLKWLKPLNGISEGSYGKCYKCDDLVLKVFFNSISFKEKGHIIKTNINNNLDVKVSGVSFPLEIKKVSGYKFSYVMPYVDGINMDDSINMIIFDDYDIVFDDLQKLYFNSILKIEEISYNKILINDLAMRNCKIKNDFSFGIVDTDFFNKTDIPDEIILNNNICSLNKMFFEYISKLIYYKKYIGKITNTDTEVLKNKIKNINLNNIHYIDDVMSIISNNKKTVGEFIYKK